MKSLLKAKIKFTKQIYPKTKLNNGDWGCLEAEVLDYLEGTEIKDFKDIKVVGNLPSINQNEIYKITAHKIVNNYGVSYEVDFISTDYNFINKSEQEIFLKHILTETQFNNLLNYSDNPIQLLKDRNIEELSKIKGIGFVTANKLITKYEQNLDYSKLFIELKDIGLTKKMIEKLIETYTNVDTIIDKIKENPYILANDVNGIGFLKADDIAIKIGIDKNSVERIKAFMVYYMEEEGRNGNSWIYPNDLMYEIRDTLGEEVTRETIKKAYTELLDENKIWVSENKEAISLMFYKNLEESIYKEIKRIMNSEKKYVVDDFEGKLKKIEERQGWKLTEEQVDFIKLGIENNFMVLYSNAGCGKSTSVNALVNILSDYNSIGTALAGRAADRLAEVTDCETMTIHRLLDWNYEGFKKTKENPLEYDIIIVDETSMIGGLLFYKLLQSIPTGSKLILIGDDGQLEAIGECNIFADLINSETIPKKKLTKIHRQAKKSAIITESLKVRNKIQLTSSNFEDKEIRGELKDFILDVHSDKIFTAPKAINYFKEYIKIKDIMDIQIITPMRLRGDISSYELNQTAQYIYNPLKRQKMKEVYKNNKKYNLREQDKVIIRRNNYKTVNTEGVLYPVYNGNVGILEKIDEENEFLIIRLKNGVKILMPFSSADSIELGYAITVHSYQGSQCDTIIGCIDYSAYSLLTKELLYTMITRASKKFILCAENKALNYTIDTTYVSKKQTFLQKLLT